jgi:LmbE family N-acetylglucosaminyl deacetylase
MKAYTDKDFSLTAVLAHPDDESFGMGGTLALYARKGVDIHLICATRGEAGEMDPDCLEGFDSIAERRESELRCAAEQLGITSVHFLNYRDSGMSGSPANQHPQALANAPIADVAQSIAEQIRRLRPQVIITFDPIGGYKHPDHIAIQAMFTTTATIPHLDQKSFTSTLFRRVF